MGLIRCNANFAKYFFGCFTLALTWNFFPRTQLCCFLRSPDRETSLLFTIFAILNCLSSKTYLPKTQLSPNGLSRGARADGYAYLYWSRDLYSHNGLTSYYNVSGYAGPGVWCYEWALCTVSSSMSGVWVGSIRVRFSGNSLLTPRFLSVWGSSSSIFRVWTESITASVWPLNIKLSIFSGGCQAAP